MTWTPHPDVAAAFARYGLPAPNPARITAAGFSAAEIHAIERYRAAVARALPNQITHDSKAHDR